MFVPDDYLHMSLKAMKQLQHGGRSNMLYGFAKGLGTRRQDGTDSFFPTKRVICGLMEYSINLFNAGSVQSVSSTHTLTYTVNI